MRRSSAAGVTAATDRAGDGAERERRATASRAELLGGIVTRASLMSLAGLQKVLAMISNIDDTSMYMPRRKRGRRGGACRNRGVVGSGCEIPDEVDRAARHRYTRDQLMALRPDVDEHSAPSTFASLASGDWCNDAVPVEDVDDAQVAVELPDAIIDDIGDDSRLLQQ
eukprot:gene5922-2598_t